MKAAQIRSQFLEFFKGQQHVVVQSASLIPADDPTLLFTTAGMVQFKPYFASPASAPYRRATTVQKCLRAGGKGSDLENVGRTSRHHTFFEMLGNFAFGDYFKKESIRWAWDFSTQIVKLPADSLWASIYLDDEEAFSIWNKDIGLPADRIVRLGKKDNFWGPAGDTGACGPCSEIYIDLGKSFAVEGADRTPCTNASCRPGCDCERYLEFWNLVFNQFYQEFDGTQKPLPKTGIDTGMGLERLTFIVQRGEGVDSVFDTDLMRPLRQVAWDEAHLAGPMPSGGAIGAKGGGPVRDQSAALNVIADHVRALTFAIADGAFPSNLGRGYVLRRLLRRAAVFAKSLRIEKPFLFKLVPKVVELYGQAYPELIKHREHATSTIKSEEDRFNETLRQGLDKLEEMLAQKRDGPTMTRELSSTADASAGNLGQKAFVLYDTYGLPADLTWDVLKRKGLAHDEAGFRSEFETEMERQKDRSRASSTFGASAATVTIADDVARAFPGRFVGYDFARSRQRLDGEGLLRLIDGPDAGGAVKFVLDQTPFYAEGGGQVGDRGLVENPDLAIDVEDVRRMSGVVVHLGRVRRGLEAVRAAAAAPVHVKARVDRDHRYRTARHHTATHLLNAVLRRVLGDHVRQAGSLVAPDRFRFDFTHPGAIGAQIQASMEAELNDVILDNLQVTNTEMGYKEAVGAGALAFFGEKYGDRVRVVRVGDPINPFSVELCGGTHVGATGEIGLLTIVGESSVAAGTRRIEAVCGTQARLHMLGQVGELEQLSQTLKSPPSQLLKKLEHLLERERDLAKKLKTLEQKLASVPPPSGAAASGPQATKVDGIAFIAHNAGEVGIDTLRATADHLMGQLGSGVIVLGGRQGEKALLVAKVSQDLTGRGIAAGDIIRPIAVHVGGSGGGKKEMAQAGGTQPEKIDEALAKVEAVLRGILGRTGQASPPDGGPK